MPWCTDIGDQKEGGRDDKWQHESNHPCRLVVSRLISEQHVGTYRDGCHEPPSGTGNSIPEGRLCVALRIDHIVHASKHQRRNRSWLCARRSTDCGPEIGLQLADRLVDLHLSSLITIEEEQYPLVEVGTKQPARVCGICWRQKVDTQEFGPDRVGFSFLEALAVIVATAGHRNAEADDQCK
jgi:hypothetical protein